MSSLDQRLEFIEKYVKLCRDYECYIDSARGSADLRIFPLEFKVDYELFDVAKECLLDDAGIPYAD